MPTRWVLRWSAKMQTTFRTDLAQFKGRTDVAWLHSNQCDAESFRPNPGKLSCPRKERLNERRRTSRKEKPLPRRRGNSLKRRSKTSAKGKIGARSTKQAIAIGLSKARRAGVDLPPPRKGKTSEKTRKNAERAYRAGQEQPNRPANPKRSRATTKALQREGGEAASHNSLARQGKRQATKRTSAERSETARKASRTRLAHSTPAERKAIAQKAARTRRRHETV